LYKNINNEICVHHKCYHLSVLCSFSIITQKLEFDLKKKYIYNEHYNLHTILCLENNNYYLGNLHDSQLYNLSLNVYTFKFASTHLEFVTVHKSRDWTFLIIITPTLFFRVYSNRTTRLNFLLL